MSSDVTLFSEGLNLHFLFLDHSFRASRVADKYHLLELKYQYFGLET